MARPRLCYLDRKGLSLSCAQREREREGMLRFSVKIVDIFPSVSFFIWVCEDLAGNQERAATFWRARALPVHWIGPNNCG